MKLEHQTAIVTGGGRGIGKEIALALARERAAILVCGRHEEPLQQTAYEIQQLGRRAMAVVADVSQDKDVEAMVQRICRRQYPGEQRRHCRPHGPHNQDYQTRMGRNAGGKSDQCLSLLASSPAGDD
jgi:NAD(P)-dependent dehydrogenase (short-subunit alcohol dehydrogenase family)